MLLQIGQEKKLAKKRYSGSFSQVYKIAGDPHVYIKTHDWAKRMLVGAEHKRHVPVVERTTERNLYRMPYYANLNRKHREAWEIYEKLDHASYVAYYNDMYEGEENLLAIVEEVDVPESIKEALRHIIYLADGSGTMKFDFKQENFGVDENGDLILRDVVWF